MLFLVACLASLIICVVLTFVLPLSFSLVVVLTLSPIVLLTSYLVRAVKRSPLSPSTAPFIATAKSHCGIDFSTVTIKARNDNSPTLPPSPLVLPRAHSASSQCHIPIDANSPTRTEVDPFLPTTNAGGFDDVVCWHITTAPQAQRRPFNTVIVCMPDADGGAADWFTHIAMFHLNGYALLVIPSLRELKLPINSGVSLLTRAAFHAKYALGYDRIVCIGIRSGAADCIVAAATENVSDAVVTPPSPLHFPFKPRYQQPQATSASFASYSPMSRGEIDRSDWPIFGSPVLAMPTAVGQPIAAARLIDAVIVEQPYATRTALHLDALHQTIGAIPAPLAPFLAPIQSAYARALLWMTHYTQSTLFSLDKANTPSSIIAAAASFLRFTITPPLLLPRRPETKSSHPAHQYQYPYTPKKRSYQDRAVIPTPLDAVSPLSAVSLLSPRPLLLIHQRTAVDGAKLDHTQLLYQHANDPKKLWSCHGADDQQEQCACGEHDCPHNSNRTATRDANQPQSLMQQFPNELAHVIVAFLQANQL